MPEIISDDGVSLNYVVRGPGSIGVIYLHSLGGNNATWEKFWDQLDVPCYCHVGLDFRGHGGSTREVCELTNERLSRDVLTLADALGLERFIVVGHSLGGKVGMKLAALAPERVRGLVLIGSPGPGLVPFRREDVAELMATYHDLDVTEAFFRPWFVVRPNLGIDAWMRSFAALPDWALRVYAEISIWTDITAEVRGITTPMLIIAGDDDPVYGPAYQREAVLFAFPHAQFVTIPRCGHGLILEQPTEIAGHCAKFFSDNQL